MGAIVSHGLVDQLFDKTRSGVVGWCGPRPATIIRALEGLEESNGGEESDR